MKEKFPTRNPSFRLLCVISSIMWLYFEPVGAAQASVPVPGVRPVEMKSVAMHGTIDVVITTRQGVVLASDSRLTRGDGSYSDNGEKVFSVGGHAACVIAGLVGADFGARGFHLADTLGAHIVTLDKAAKGGILSANDIANVVVEAVNSVSGLLTPNTAMPSFVAEVSSVSLNSSGNLEWVTLFIPSAVHFNSGQSFFNAGAPVFLQHTTNLGLRFDAHALGQEQVVDSLLLSDGTNHRVCGKDPNAPNLPDWCIDTLSLHSSILEEFYRRKRSGTLDQFTLEEAVALAKILIRATFKASNPRWGVGGPITLLTVTKAGVRWVARPPEQKFEPPFRRTLEADTFRNSSFPMDLDGLQCLACTFENDNLYYDGEARVELIQPTFNGSCTLILGPEARERRPNDVAYLEGLASGHCEIKQE